MTIAVQSKAWLGAEVALFNNGQMMYASKPRNSLRIDTPATILNSTTFRLMTDIPATTMKKEMTPPVAQSPTRDIARQITVLFGNGIASVILPQRLPLTTTSASQTRMKIQPT